MASFDVNSLFTNVSLTECVNLCCDFLFKYSVLISYNECKFSLEKFYKLLDFAVEEKYFIFNKLLYDQIDGVAMGSLLRPSFANIFMCALERKFLYNCPFEFKLLFIVVMFMIHFVFSQ